MRTCKTLLSALAVMACGAALTLAATTDASTQSAAPPPASDTKTYVLAPCDKIIGLPLRNSSDKNLGEIGDVLADPGSGELRYAVLEVGGFLGMGEDRRVVPWSYVQIVRDEKDADKFHARTTLTEAQIKAAPTCKKDDNKLDENLDRRIEAAFGKNDAWKYHGDGKPMFAWVSELDGVELEDTAGLDIGKVQDIILAPQNGCIAYAVVDTTNEAGDKNVAVPWSKLKFQYDSRDKLTARTDLELARFKGAPEFDRKDWKRMSSTAFMNELATYYKADPFWKNSRFAEARKSPPPGS